MVKNVEGKDNSKFLKASYRCFAETRTSGYILASE